MPYRVCYDAGELINWLGVCMGVLRNTWLYLKLAGVCLVCWMCLLFPAPSNAQEPFHLSVLGQVGGVGHAAAWDGGRLYAGIGPRLTVWDITDPDHPAKLGQSALLPGIVRDIALAGGYAYVALDPAGLGVLSLEDPARPAWVGGWEPPAPAAALVHQPPYLFLALGPAGVVILDVSDPVHPAELARIETPGIANDVDVCGAGLLAIADGPAGGLRLWSVADVHVPAELGSLDTPGDANAVACAGGTAWVADGLPGLLGITVADPTAPAEVGRYNSPGDARHVVVRGELAYLADGWVGGLSIVSLADPAHPSRLSRLDTDGLALAVALGDGLAAVVDGPLPGIQLVDVSSAAAPARRGIIPTLGYAWDVDVAGGVAYVANGFGGLWTVSVADPRHPVPLANVRSGPASVDEWARRMGVTSPANAALGELRTGAEAMGIRVAGTRAYLADGWAGLRVIAIADPAAPHLLGTLDTPGTAQALDIAGEMAYVADGAGGLRVVWVGAPTVPQEVGASTVPAEAADVAVSGYIAYVADRLAGLRSIAVVDPSHPISYGMFPLAGPVLGVDVQGTWAAVAEGPAGAHLLDVNDPTDMRRLSTVAGRDVVQDVELADGQMFLADGKAGVMAVQLDAGGVPVDTAWLRLAGEATAVCYANGRLYVTTREGGLWIVGLGAQAGRVFLPLLIR